MKLKAELKQKRPFESLEEEVHLNLVRTADALGRKVSELLKPAGLSRTQYNVLRILRGAGPEGLRCGEPYGPQLRPGTESYRAYAPKIAA